MKMMETAPNRFTSNDDLVEVYQVSDGSWRVAYYPFADKDRNLSKKQAFAIAKKRHKEAVDLLHATGFERQIMGGDE
jgi:hypothetical protein